METVYLDYAAATPLDPLVLKEMRPYLAEKFYNSSASYAAAKGVAKDIEAARAKIAHWLGARSSEVIFTAGGTEANNLALRGIMAKYPKGNMVISAIEHPAVVEPSLQYKHHIAPVTADGVVDVPALERLIDDNTVLISVMYANNEIGTIQPIRKLAQVARAVLNKRNAAGSNRPLYLHTDACQAAAYLDLHVSRLGVDLMTINAGKIYGPKQCGALYARAGIDLKPLISGGGQELGRRSGTENVANIAGFAQALDMAQKHRAKEAMRLQELQRLFFNLLQTEIPRATINGSRKNRLPNNVHITIPGIDNERLIMELDERGIQCAAGSACSAAKEEASTVLAAIGLDEASARSSLRFTMGRGTTEQHIRQTITALTQLV